MASAGDSDCEELDPARQLELAEFRQLVSTLLFHRGFRQSQLAAEMARVAVTSSEGLPKVRVLYANHGKYSYSTAFQQYLDCSSMGAPGEDGAGTAFDAVPPLAALAAAQRVPAHLRHRVLDVSRVLQFGEQLFKRHAGVARLVYAEVQLNLERAWKECCGLRTGLSQLDITRTRLHQLEALTDARSGVLADWSELSHEMKYGYHFPGRMSGMPTDFASYTKQARSEMQAVALELLQDLSKEEPKARSRLAAQLLQVSSGNQELADALMQAAVAKMPEPQDSSRTGLPYTGWGQKEWYRHSNGQWLDFCGAIAYYGVEHSAIWRCQRHFGGWGGGVMQWLLRCAPAPLDKALGGMMDASLLQTCYQRLGIMAASGQPQAYHGLCGLAIAELPQLAEWRIEYDHDKRCERVVGLQ